MNSNSSFKGKSVMASTLSSKPAKERKRMQMTTWENKSIKRGLEEGVEAKRRDQSTWENWAANHQG